MSGWKNLNKSIDFWPRTWPRRLRYIENEIKNEIICVYNKKEEDGIDILHDYKLDYVENYYKESYNEAKNNINEENIEIYVNGKKIKFNYIYETEEIGLIKIKFKFKKLLTSTAFMFSYCKFLESIDVSSFNTNNVIDMSFMFTYCESLKSIDLSSFNTYNVTNMSEMFRGCESLESIDLSSFNTNNVNNMRGMFRGCESLKSIDLSLFNTYKVTDMSYMFSDCKS